MLNNDEPKMIDDLNQIPEGYFNHNQKIEALIFKNITFESFKFDTILVRNCEFINCKFLNSFFDNADFQRVSFTGSYFDNCILTTNFRYITGTFRDSELSETDFSNAFIQNVKFIQTKFIDVDFNKIKAKSIDFTSCDFGKITFENANIVRGNFKEINGITRSMFYNTVLDDCSFDWNEAFIIMEFNNANNDNLYSYGIIEILKARGIEPKRVDQYEFKGKITEEIMINITTSKIIIAECSAPNKNVYFEVGYALGRNKKIIFLIDDAKNIPFDLKDYKFIIHNNKIDSLKQQLSSRIDFLMAN
jgi:fluoroquinolone resistance protein